VTTGFDYAAWVRWTDAFAVGQDWSMEQLRPMTPQIGAEAARRLSDRVFDAVGRRMNLWAQQLSRDVELGIRQPASLESALVASKRRLGVVHRLCTSELLLPELRDALTTGVIQTLERCQLDLEQGQLRDRARTGEELLRIYKRNSLPDAFRRLDNIGGPAGDPSATTSPLVRGPRRVLMTGSEGLKADAERT